MLTNAGGRSTFQNVGSTRRSGAELGGRWQLHPDWRALLALTYLDAVYDDNFQTCARRALHQPADRVTVPAGNRIAGTMEKSAFASLAWRVLPQTELALELRYQGQMPVNDRNTDFSPSATVSALRAEPQHAAGPGHAVVAGAAGQPDGQGLCRRGHRQRRQRPLLRDRRRAHGLLAVRWQAPF